MLCYTNSTMEKLLERKDINEQIFKTIIFDKNIYSYACDFFKNKKIFIITSSTPKNIYLQHFINILNEKNVNFNYGVLKKRISMRSQ